ncbi:MAG: hypothetical protein F8N38_03805 [Hungatella sp.]|nr:hypothetical protein [Hungatella sp.]
MSETEKTVFSVEEVKEAELFSWIGQQLPGESYVYAILDNTIALGVFKSEIVTAGFAGQKCIKSLPVELIREVRVFQDYGEIKAVRKNDSFMVRLIVDKEEDTEWITTLETQKIWGKVKNIFKDPEWCLLESDRGSRILLPQSAKLNEEKGLVVKKYYQLFPKENRELFKLMDERLCGFTDWNSKIKVLE